MMSLSTPAIDDKSIEIAKTAYEGVDPPLVHVAIFHPAYWGASMGQRAELGLPSPVPHQRKCSLPIKSLFVVCALVLLLAVGLVNIFLVIGNKSSTDKELTQVLQQIAQIADKDVTMQESLVQLDASLRNTDKELRQVLQKIEDKSASASNSERLIDQIRKDLYVLQLKVNGDDLAGNVGANTWQACAAKCFSYQGCLYWTFTPGSKACHLKDNKSTLGKKGGKISGTKADGKDNNDVSQKYKNLFGVCSNKLTVNGWIYKLCFNEEVRAFKEVDPSWDPMLGTAENQEWSVSSDGVDTVTYYDGDDDMWCPKKREIKIKIKCGESFKMIKAADLGSCEYSMEVEAKEACQERLSVLLVGGRVGGHAKSRSVEKVVVTKYPDGTFSMLTTTLQSVPDSANTGGMDHHYLVRIGTTRSIFLKVENRDYIFDTETLTWKEDTGVKLAPTAHGRMGSLSWKDDGFIVFKPVEISLFQKDSAKTIVGSYPDGYAPGGYLGVVVKVNESSFIITGGSYMDEWKESKSMDNAVLGTLISDNIIWTSLQPMNTPRDCHCLFILNNKVVAVGSSRSVEYLDLLSTTPISKQRWTLGPDLPDTLMAPTCSVAEGGTFAIIAGGIYGGEYSDLVFVMNEALEVQELTRLQATRVYHESVLLGDQE